VLDYSAENKIIPTNAWIYYTDVRPHKHKLGERGIMTTIPVTGPAKRRRFAGIAALTGSPSFLFCGMGHICMAGHMQHPPFPAWHFISDGLWATLFVAAGIFGLSSDFRRRLIFGVLCLFLPIMRLGLGSLGGVGFLLELPAWITVVVMSIRGLRSSYGAAGRGQPSTQPSAGGNAATPRASA